MRKEEIARQKKERALAKERRVAEKKEEDKRDLVEAKRILARHQRNRQVCDKKLTCSQLVLLLRDMGLDKEAHARDGKRLLQADLRDLYWTHHVNIVAAPSSPDSQNTTHDDSDTDTADYNHSDCDSHHSDSDSHHPDSDSDSDPDSDSECELPLTELLSRAPPRKRSRTRRSINSHHIGSSGDEGEWNFGFQIGDRVEVHWPAEGGWFTGDITDINESDRQFQVYYFDDREDYWHPHDMEVRTPL